MISFKRYTVYAALAVFAILTIANFRENIALHARVQYSSFFRSTQKHDDGRFYWADVPVDYPVKSLTALPTAKPQKLPKVQFDFPKEIEGHASIRKEKQEVVKLAFKRCWAAYKRNAWMSDEVKPLSGEFSNGFGGWAATLVDSLDTLWIMGLKEEFEEAVQAAITIDLGAATSETINVFETTIRHLGGFIAAYDLSGDKRLLEKAKEFGEMLLKAFDTPNRMPITRWKPAEALREPQTADPTVLLAEIGSLTLEFTRLSQITKDMRYFDAVDRIMRKFAEQQEDTHLPGMFPVSVNGEEADFTRDTFFTLGAMSDSFYEYLPKMHALLGGTDLKYSKMYNRSMAVAIKHNLWKPMTHDDSNILMSGAVRAEMGKPPKLEAQGQHLVCFAGGMFFLGGRLMQNDTHLNIGRKLTDGCIWVYRASPIGLMPEVFSMTPCPSQTASCNWDEEKWKENVKLNGPEGLSDADVEAYANKHRISKPFTSIGDRRYILRPEAIESVFIAYRITGNDMYLHRGWEMLSKILKATETNIANAALADVTFSSAEQAAAEGVTIQMDSMESFWMAETLKYFYLLYSETDLISLDEWVFNTEAHPFKRPVA